MKKIRVLIVDDSALMRMLLERMLSSDPYIEVVGVAANPEIARGLIRELNPDVLALDIEMPRMNGLDFLAHIMRLRPMPVVMISSLTQKGADASLRALELGAVDFVAKPSARCGRTIELSADEIISKIKGAAGAKLKDVSREKKTPERQSFPEYGIKAKAKECPFARQLIAIGASTGGTQALISIAKELPADMKAILIAQHIPELFSKRFAQHLNSAAKMQAVEAEEGMAIRQGHIYVAPGDGHLRVERKDGHYYCTISRDAPVNHHRPSVDVLLASVAESVGHDAIGLVMTGMGSDGAEGLKAMSLAGAKTMVQDQISSVVWGMPSAALKLHQRHEVVALSDIATVLQS